MALDKKTAKLNVFIETKYIPIDNKIKLAIFVALIVLPIGLFYFFPYSKNVQKVEELNKQKVTLQTAITKAKKAAAELDKIKADIKETEEKFKNTAAVLPKEKEIPGLLTNINRLRKSPRIFMLKSLSTFK